MGKSLRGKELAPQVGLEPTTLRLTAECSTIELLRSKADGTILITAERAAGCQPGWRRDPSVPCATLAPMEGGRNANPPGDCARVSWRLREVADFLAQRAARPWWELKTLRALLGGEAPASTALGHDFGPDRQPPEYAFLAVDATKACTGEVQNLKRSFVLLRLGRPAIPWALVTFDLMVSADPALPKSWAAVQPSSESGWRVSTFSSRRASTETVFVNAIQFLDGEAGAPMPVEEFSSLELAGVRLADRVALFHAETTTARSAVSFRVEGTETLKYLVTGLAPGDWEIWWNGWLEDPQGFVEPRSGALYFEGPAGSYFLRRRS